MEINGIAHAMLTVADFPRARAFYGRLLPALGLKPLIDADGMYYCIGGRTALGIQRGDAQFVQAGDRFVQGRVGLHHVCFRARQREDVDALHALLVEIGAHIVHAPEEAQFAPGYYSVLFEDPEGIRLEMNFVPGRGHLDRVEAESQE
ncbi:MAG: VOC family protein [Deltaproteobacteria bacterium]|nr:VOC family protein [Deltaproteobacteria bacterium]